MRNLAIYLALTVLGLMLAVPGLRASEFDKKTFVTFNQAMEIPGMVLPAGEYVIKRADRSLPDVVQFSNSNENHVYATVFALPTYRPRPTSDVVIVTEERRANSPEAIKKWFYPGDTIGAEFVYPKGSERLMAMATPSSSMGTPSSVPSSTRNEPAVTAAEQPSEAAQAPLQRNDAQPSSQPEEIAQATPQSSAQPEPSSRGSQSAQTAPSQSQTEPAAQQELPRTASSLPLAVVLGLLSVVGGWSLRKFSRPRP